MTRPATADALGIDFGTSNTGAGVMTATGPRLIQLEPGAATIPTAVFHDVAENEILIGEAANRALLAGEEGRYMRALKSVLGTSLLRERRRMMGKPQSLLDILSGFLAEVKARAEAAEGRRFTRALSGRPVHFHSGDPDRDAQALVDLREAYDRAGFTHVEFMHEPEAAAIAYGADQAEDGLGLIVDIGGGTSDFSVFRAVAGGAEILASHGVRVGGTDFDRSVSLDHAMPLLGRGAEIGREMGAAGSHPAPNAIFHDLASWEKIPFLYAAPVKREVEQMRRLALKPELFERLAAVLEEELGHALAFAAERGKIEANGAGQGSIAMTLIESGLAAPISAEGLAGALAPHAARIGEGACETLTMAGVAPEDISRVIYVGGSSLMHAVRDEMARILPQAAPRDAHAFTAVADGLSIAAARMGS